MARRMFDIDFLKGDVYLGFDPMTKALYIQMNLEADDDGFVDCTQKIMRMLGAEESNLKTLLDKKFLLKFESGVFCIKHWRIHNFIRKDIYSMSRHLKERDMLYVRENGAYSLCSDGAVKIPKEHFTLESLFNVNVTLTDSERDVELGKVRKGKVRKDKPPKKGERGVFTALGAEIIKRFTEVDPKNKLYYNNTSQRAAADFLITEYGFEEVTKRISFLPLSNKAPYFPTITTPCQLRDKWVDLENAADRAKRKKIMQNTNAFG